MGDLNGKRGIARQKLHHARARYDAALRDYMGALKAFETVFNDPLNVTDKRSRPRSKLATDPDLSAFVGARLGRMSLQQIVDEVAAKFPPDRRISISALQRWDAKMRANQASQ